MPRCLTSAKCLKSIGNPFIQIPQHPMSSRRRSIEASKHRSIEASKHRSIEASKHRSIEASKHRSIGMSNMSSPCHRHVLLFHHLRHLHLWFLVLPACRLNVSRLWQYSPTGSYSTIHDCPTVPCRVPCSILHYLKLSPWTSCWKMLEGEKHAQRTISKRFRSKNVKTCQKSELCKRNVSGISGLDPVQPTVALLQVSKVCLEAHIERTRDITRHHKTSRDICSEGPTDVRQFMTYLTHIFFDFCVSTFRSK